MPNHIPNIEALQHKLFNAYLTKVRIGFIFRTIRSSSLKHVQKGINDLESLIKNNSMENPKQLMENPKQLKDLLAEQISELSSITTILEEINLSQHPTYKGIKKISLVLQTQSDGLNGLKKIVIDKNSKVYLSIQEQFTRYLLNMDNLDSEEIALAFIATFSNNMGFELKKIFQSKTTNLNIFKKELTTWTQEEWIALWKDDLCQFSTEKLKSTLKEYRDYIKYKTTCREIEEDYNFNTLTQQIKEEIKELDSLIELINLIAKTPSCKKAVLSELEKLKTFLDLTSKLNASDLDEIVTRLNQWVSNVNLFKSNHQDNFISLGKDCYGLLDTLKKAATKKEAEIQTDLTESKENATQTDLTESKENATQTDLTESKENATQTDLTESKEATQIIFFINDLSKYHKLVEDLHMYSKTLSTQSSLGQNKSRSLMKIFNACKVDNNLLSREQITNIQTVIQQEEKVLNQHRHHSLFNCFFSLFKATTLNNRVTSLKKVNELDNYLQQILESTHSQKLQIG